MTIDKTKGRLSLKSIVKDWKGEVIAAKSLAKLENLEPVAAKALNVLHEAEFCSDLGFRYLIIE